MIGHDSGMEGGVERKEKREDPGNGKNGGRRM